LREEAETIAIAAALVGCVIFVMRRPFTAVCFDEEYAAARGINIRAVDLTMMALLLAVTVIGLKVAGLVLIVALTIIPPVAARFWTNRPGRMVVIAAIIGAAASYLGAVISSLDRGLPTGAVIVLMAFALFAISLVFSPVRGLLAGGIEQFALRKRVHERQGLLALARGEPIYDALTRKVLRRAGYMRADNVATLDGRAAAAHAIREEALWHLYRARFPDDAAGLRHQGLTALDKALPPDVVADLRLQLETKEAP
jgi:manganese/zinc/iron transport system permease protein